MREIRPFGSEGGAKPSSSLPLSGRVQTIILNRRQPAESLKGLGRLRLNAGAQERDPILTRKRYRTIGGPTIKQNKSKQKEGARRHPGRYQR